MHTLVLGNGILGLTIAFRLAKLAKSSDRITIVGKYSRAGSATLAAAAMLNSFAEIEAGGLDSERDLFRFELSHLATQMWPRFESEIIEAAGTSIPRGCANCEGCAGGGCFSTGTYVVNNTAADNLDDENFEAILAALKEFGEPHNELAPRDIPNYHPEQRYRATKGVLIHNEGWFNPRLMVEKLDVALSRFPQVDFVDDSVTALRKSGELVDSVELSSGRILEGDQFVLATGATVSEILDKSNLGIPVQRVFYGVGVSLELKSPEYPHTHCIRTPNRGLACGLYSVPYFYEPNLPNDHILVGASNFVSPVPCALGRISSVENLLRGVMEQINTNFYRAELVRVNVGWRPTSQDTYPLIGKTSINNLIIATGTKRDGFHMSPLISEVVASMLLGKPIDNRWLQFAPERQQIRDLNRQDAIAKSVRHQMSAAYQHGFTPSKSRMNEQIAQMYRERLERLHDQVGAVDWGIPPEMLDMYRYGHALA